MSRAYRYFSSRPKKGDVSRSIYGCGPIDNAPRSCVFEVATARAGTYSCNGIFVYNLFMAVFKKAVLYGISSKILLPLPNYLPLFLSTLCFFFLFHEGTFRSCSRADRKENRIQIRSQESATERGVRIPLLCTSGWGRVPE